MPKLTENITVKPQGVGRQAILELIDELNAKRALKGFRQRYRPVVSRGELTMEFYMLDHGLSDHSPSRRHVENLTQSEAE